MIISIIIFLLLSLIPPSVFGFYDPRTVPNNRYGIHIIDMNDLSDARILVDSSGGDWGYVTIVIAENDRNLGKWQNAMNEMRRLHLIPIIRIATHVEKISWVIPQEVDADKWADFLNQLNWPTENRYVVLFNEPNHAKEWGGTINPEEFARVSVSYAKKLKEKSEDFFILPAGLDESAPNGSETMDSAEYMRRIRSTVPEFFDTIDGWTSHAYPNPGFAGPVTAFGKGTIRGFIWERTFLRSIGVTKSYPIFVTETGWQHSGGKLFNPSLPTPEEVGERLTYAARNVWNDTDIVAVTPFLLNYQDIPFDHFSFRKYIHSEYYPHFFSYQGIPKIDGKPKQRESYTFLVPFFPPTLVTDSSYTFSGTLVNNGQAILDPKDGDEITVTDDTQTIVSSCSPVSRIEPTEKGDISCVIHTPKKEGTITLSMNKKNGASVTPILSRSVSLIPPPGIRGSAQLGWKSVSSSRGATVLIYDKENTLVQKFTDQIIDRGHLTVTGISNVIPGVSYRIVLLVPYYLPRQTIALMTENQTTVTFPRLLPFDFDNDGALIPKDIPAWLFTKPHDIMGRFF